MSRPLETRLDQIDALWLDGAIVTYAAAALTWTDDARDRWWVLVVDPDIPVPVGEVHLRLRTRDGRALVGLARRASETKMPKHWTTVLEGVEDLRDFRH
jgi:hypothetical protein